MKNKEKEEMVASPILISVCGGLHFAIDASLAKRARSLCRQEVFKFAYKNNISIDLYTEEWSVFETTIPVRLSPAVVTSIYKVHGIKLP